MICFVLSTEVLVLHKPHLLHKVVSSFTLRLPENIIFSAVESFCSIAVSTASTRIFCKLCQRKCTFCIYL